MDHPPLWALGLGVLLLPCCSSGGSGAGFSAGPGEPGGDAGATPSTDSAAAADVAQPAQGDDAGGPGADASYGDHSVDAIAAAPSSYDVAKTFAGSYAALVTFRKVIALNGGALGSMNALASFYLTLQLTADAPTQTVKGAVADCHVDLTGSNGTLGLAGAVLQIRDVVLTTTVLDPVVFSASTSGATTSWSLTAVRGPIGWHWASPADALPTSTGDSRVFDQDMDGNPAVTMHVLWNGTDTPLYFVQSQHEALSGTVSSNGDLLGTTVDTTGQNVIGNTAALSGATVSWTPDSNTADDMVRIVRVPSQLTCAALVAQKSTLFP